MPVYVGMKLVSEVNLVTLLASHSRVQICGTSELLL